MMLLEFVLKLKIALPVKMVKEAHIPWTHKAQTLCWFICLKTQSHLIITGLPIGSSVTFLYFWLWSVLCKSRHKAICRYLWCGCVYVCVWVCVRVCARCMQMQMFFVDLRLWLNPAQKMSPFLYNLGWSACVCVCVYKGEKDICTYDSWADVQ